MTSVAPARFVELTLTGEEGRAIDLPFGSITFFQEMVETKNEAVPDAGCFIRYSRGQEDRMVWVRDTFPDLVFRLDINVNPGDWLGLTLANGDRIAVLKHNIIEREAVRDGEANCAVTVRLTSDGKLGTFFVQDTRDEIKEQMDAHLAASAPIEMPVAS